MRLMTIFQLAILTDKELQALALRASEDEGNAKLAQVERDAAALTRDAIARRRAIAPKP